jgi:hypothetical protein
MLPRRITLLEAIEALYPLMMLIHVFLDNARYHYASSWCSNSWCGPVAASSCISFRATARISIRSSGYGA